MVDVGKLIRLAPEELYVPLDYPLRAEFGQIYARWLEEMDSPTVSLSGSPAAWIMLPSYRKLILLGMEALPLIMEKMADGVFHLNWAAQMITGITPSSSLRRVSEQNETRWWLGWWKNQQPEVDKHIVHCHVTGLSGKVEFGADQVERLTIYTDRFAVPSRLWTDEDGAVWVLDNPVMGNAVLNGIVIYRRER